MDSGSGDTVIVRDPVSAVLVSAVSQEDAASVRCSEHPDARILEERPPSGAGDTYLYCLAGTREDGHPETAAARAGGPVNGACQAVAAELRALAVRIPADGPPVVTLARQRAADATEAAVAALGTDPTLAERQQRDLDVLAEILRRLAPLARQAAAELERRRLATTGADTAHLGRTNPVAPQELDAVSERVTVIAARVTAAVLPDWDSPRRIRELSASRMPGEEEVAEIAGRLHRAVAPALNLSYPDPEAVRLAALAEQIAPQIVVVP